MTQSRVQAAEEQVPEGPERVQLILRGEDAARFRRFKELENIKVSSVAAVKLILDRLDHLKVSLAPEK